MKARTKVLLSTSLILSLCGIWRAGLADEPSPASQPAAAATAAEPQAAVTEPEAAVTEPEAGETESETKPKHTEETVKGAFGIPLGEKFDPSMVAKIVSQEERTYGAEPETKVVGTHYVVEPQMRSGDFQKFEVTTTPDGIIFEIKAEYVHDKKENQCEKTKAMAADFETKYGKPRGKGFRGSWYSFRPPTDLTRSASIYAHRCKAGIYSVAYRDHAALKASMPEPGKAGESLGSEGTTESGEPAQEEAAGGSEATDESTEAGETTESSKSAETEKAAGSGETGEPKASASQ